MSADGIRVDPAKIEAVVNWKCDAPNPASSVERRCHIYININIYK